MIYDDVIFYLPALGSIAIVGISAVLSWAAWRLIRARLRTKARKPDVPEG